MACLLVIIPDRLSVLVKKGEITARYYNPGNLFDEIHILMVNDDQVDVKDMQKTAGRAKLFIHNLPYGNKLVVKSLGYRPFLLRRWAAAGVRLAEKIKPDLIRCYVNHLNGFVAAEINRKLGIKYILSLHGNPDSDVRYHARWRRSWREKIFNLLIRRVEELTVRQAACVICVYRFIEPYVRKCGAKRIEIIYNAVNPENLLPKENYHLSAPVKIIIPGRQMAQKNPAPLIQALAELPQAELTLIGDGPIHHNLEELASQLGIADSCIFHRAMNNDVLCRSLRDYDILVSVNDYGGVSKVELEAALVGMPVVTNAHPLEDEPEILGKNCLVVDGSPDSYRQALERLISSYDLRQNLGVALRNSVKDISPEKMEKKVEELYRNYLE